MSSSLSVFVLFSTVLSSVLAQQRLDFGNPGSSIEGNPNFLAKWNVTVAGGVGATQLPTDWDASLIQSTGFDFSKPWLGFYLHQWNVSLVVDISCTPAAENGICETGPSGSVRTNKVDSENGISLHVDMPELVPHVRLQVSMANATASSLKASQRINVVINRLLVLQHPDSPGDAEFLGFDNGVTDISLGPFESTQPIDREAHITIAFSPTFLWETRFGRDENLLRGNITMSIPQLSLRVMPLANANINCEDVEPGQTIFDNVTRVETNETITFQPTSGVRSHGPEKPQCYSFDPAQGKLVAPANGRRYEEPKDGSMHLALSAGFLAATLAASLFFIA